MTIDYQSIYIQLGRLAEAIPDLARRYEAPALQWLGRVQVLISTLDPKEGSQFKAAADTLIGQDSFVGANTAKVLFIFYWVLALA